MKTGKFRITKTILNAVLHLPSDVNIYSAEDADENTIWLHIVGGDSIPDGEPGKELRVVVHEKKITVEFKSI